MSLLSLVTIMLALPGFEETTRPIKLSPKLATGLEVVYHGTVTETKLGRQGATYEQPYELDASMLVFEVDSKRVANVGCYTVLRLPDPTVADRMKELDEVSSIRFDLIKVSPTGVPTWSESGAQIGVNIDGLPATETGYLFELPEKAVNKGDSWTIKKGVQGPVTCKIVGMESTAGVPCVVVDCLQESSNWQKPNSSKSWRVRTMAWIDRESSLIQRVERLTEVREPNSSVVDHTIRAEYDQVSNLRYQGPLLAERSADFRAAFAAQKDMEAALAVLDHQSKSKLSAVRHSLKFALDQLYSTPYRPAIVRLASAAEKAEKKVNAADAGDSPVVGQLRGDVIGKRARHFVFHNAETKESITLSRLKGSPVAIVFMDPNSRLSVSALEDVVATAAANGSRVKVYAVGYQMEPAEIRSLRKKVPGEYVLCYGKGGSAADSDSLPRVWFIDAQGILRAHQVGYGPELGPTLTKAISEYGAVIEQIGEQQSKPSFLR